MNTLDPRPRIALCAKKTRGQIDVVDPYDRKPLQTIDLADSEDLEQALAAAAQIFEDRKRWLSAEQRVDILSKAAEKIEKRLEEFTVGLAREGGKPRADAHIEVVRAIDGLRNCAELPRGRGVGEAIPVDLNAASRQRISFATREPIGVISAISAFNHPLNLAVHQVGPAIAAGCPFILKPGTATPCSAYRLTDVLRESGLPPEHGQALVIGDRSLAQALACDPRVAFLSFIGSAQTGWMLRSRLAPGTRCALEHGGAAPVIVDRGVDIEKTAASLARGGYYHAGQVCISVQRVFAHEALARDLAEALARAGQAMPVGAQLQEATAIGPMIAPAEVKRVHQWVSEAAAGGGEILSGGKAISPTCYPATLVWNTPADCRLAREEVFGPVISVNSFSSVDEAVDQANSLKFKFQASVFSENLDFAMYCYRRLNASAVLINDHSAWRVDWMPFSGLGHSGYGVGGIPYTYEDMQVNKMAVVHSPSL